MDTIGIKLADGSFYPIFEDGKPAKKTIELTTVKDNQTTVHVDVYRSNTESMSDAQYVDTLEIANLNPHINGEPSLNLDIELDENNSLSAKIHDPETGKESEKQINLISRPESERDEPANFNIINQDAIDTPFDFDSPAAMQETPSDKSDDTDDTIEEILPDEPAENTLEDPLGALDALPDFKDNLDEIPEDIDETIQSLESEQEQTLPDPLAALDALPDFKDNLDDFDSNDSLGFVAGSENTEPEIAEPVEETLADPLAALDELPDFKDNLDDGAADMPANETPAEIEEPAATEPEEITADTASSLAALDELPDFKDNLDDGAADTPANETPAEIEEPAATEPEEITADTASSLAALDELPDFKDNLDDGAADMPANETPAEIEEPAATEPEEITADTASSLAALDELPDFKDNLDDTSDDTSYAVVTAENAQPQEEFEKPFDAIFNPPDEQNDEPMKPILPEKDPSFEDVLHSITGNDDNTYDDMETQSGVNEEAKETLEEISPEKAIPSDAEFVDSLGGEEVSSGFADVAFEPVSDTSFPEMPAAPQFDETVAEESSQDMEFDTSFDTPDNVSDENQSADDTVYFGAPADSSNAEQSVADEFDTSIMDESGSTDFSEPVPQFDESISSGDAEETFEPATIFEDDDSSTENSSADDFSLPNFDNLSSLSEPVIPDLETGITSSSSNSDFDMQDFDTVSSSASEGFVLPDIGDLDEAVKEEANVDFELPEFENTANPVASTPFSETNMFGDLYDKETLEGKSSNAFEDNSKKTRVPMFICIACAAICILCLFFLFIIPSKYNPLHKDTEIAMADNAELIKAKDNAQTDAGLTGSDSTAGLIADNSTQSETSVTSDAKTKETGKKSDSETGSSTKKSDKKEEPVAKIDLSPKPVPAKENEIVIATVPSKVVPETPVKNAKNIPDTKYTIKWGDTLWDIANAFYKNPWKYTYLAEYNHLPNPNYIKTGSVLLIPAE